MGLEPETFRLRSERATIELQGLMSVEWLKICRFYLGVLFVEIYLQLVVDVAKKFFANYIFFRTMHIERPSVLSRFCRLAKRDGVINPQNNISNKF